MDIWSWSYSSVRMVQKSDYEFKYTSDAIDWVSMCGHTTVI